MSQWKVFGAAALLAGLIGTASPAGAAAVNYLPSHPVTITYTADFEGSTWRPIVGEILTGRMRLTVYPDGIISGTYIPQSGSPFHVSGGLQANGRVWLEVGRAHVTGEWQPNGSITGYAYGPPALNYLKFRATTTS